MPRLQSLRGEYLLRQFVISGENHRIMNKWYQKFFAYLDRYYVSYHGQPTLEVAGKNCFKKLVFEHLKSEACRAMLTLVDEEREGSTIDTNLMR